MIDRDDRRDRGELAIVTSLSERIAATAAVPRKAANDHPSRGGGRTKRDDGGFDRISNVAMVPSRAAGCRRRRIAALSRSTGSSTRRLPTAEIDRLEQCWSPRRSAARRDARHPPAGAQGPGQGGAGRPSSAAVDLDPMRSARRSKRSTATSRVQPSSWPSGAPLSCVATTTRPPMRRLVAVPAAEGVLRRDRGRARPRSRCARSLNSSGSGPAFRVVDVGLAS